LSIRVDNHFLDPRSANLFSLCLFDICSLWFPFPEELCPPPLSFFPREDIKLDFKDSSCAGPLSLQGSSLLPPPVWNRRFETKTRGPDLLSP